MRKIRIHNPFPGAVCYLVRAASSTQDEARRLAESSAAAVVRDGPAARSRGLSRGRAAFPAGSLVAAEEQTSGRGRFPGRTWESEKGKNLLFSLFLEPSAAFLPGLPIRIGLALRDAVLGYAVAAHSGFPNAPKLKWPNDLMFGDRKAAGILCEAGQSGVFAGVGLNCNQRSFPLGLEATATSLALELGFEVDRWDVLQRFLDGLAALLVEPQWRELADAALWKKGEAAYFLPGAEALSEARAGEPLFGTPEGLDEAGSLIFRINGENTALAYPAGELQGGKHVDHSPRGL